MQMSVLVRSYINGFPKHQQKQEKNPEADNKSSIDKDQKQKDDQGKKDDLKSDQPNNTD